ncbi:MAG: response regulator [Acidobacteria bacterium]|nr:response regulator [Acidobacteriota bacterium]
MNIVIVDNEQTILRSLEILLKPKTDEIHCFLNPKEALEYIKTHGYTIDILLADYFMPDMNGLELIRKGTPFLNPETVKVIISGHVELIPDALNNQWPVDHLLSKPFDLARLFSLLPSGARTKISGST